MMPSMNKEYRSPADRTGCADVVTLRRNYFGEQLLFHGGGRFIGHENLW
jgi:hypothetical protein